MGGGVITLDFTQHTIPTQAFIGGKYVDCENIEKHELRSSVNDEVVTPGTYRKAYIYRLYRQLGLITPETGA